jgi:elongation factor G
MLLAPLRNVRNIGIVAHIDAGKTTTTERFLYYAGLTHKIGEVHDGNTVMDFRDDERERGITISAAATTFVWNDHQINLIDTPGHIDFTAEVERSLRVLDGAVVVFSGVEGVEPQSETVWHQADRYAVPRLAFINKLDRVGADHERVLAEIATRLGVRCAFVNLPHGLEDRLDGVLDVIDQCWLVFDPETRGGELEQRPLPADVKALAAAARDRLVEQVAEIVDWLADLYLAGEPIGAADLRRGIREATVAGRFVPVLCGAALRDLGIRPILDAVCDYLPSPADRPPMSGINPDTDRAESRGPDPREPFAALVFKVVAHPSADLFWLRVYSGSLRDDERCYHPRTETRVRLRRLLRIHADRSEPVDSADCGDIIAVPGLKHVVTGDTLCDPERRITFEPIQFPETVVSVAVEPQTSADRDRLLEVVSRLTREDPTFTYHTDADTGQLILSGMGELHLEILGNRMQREFNVHARLGRPRVAYHETAAERGRGVGEFDRRIGDVQMSARAVVEIAPRERPPGTRGLPPVEIAVEKGMSHLPVPLQQSARKVIADVCSAGGPNGFPVVDVAVAVVDLQLSDAPDPSVPLLPALTMAMRRAFSETRMLLLEPVMRLEARTPEDFLGAVVRDLSTRRAEIRETSLQGRVAVVRALAPLAEMFGYSTQLRSLTQGRGSFSMEPFDYQPVPEHVANRQNSAV